MTREELREKVALLFCGNYGIGTCNGKHICRACFTEADAAIALVLEEAARVAETPVETMCCNNPLWNGNPEDQPECCGKPEYRWGDPGEIAAAIRALKEKTNGD